MKRTLYLTLLAVATVTSTAARADQLVPAGSVISCTVAESKISSKTEHVGDPVLCTLGHTEAYGRGSFPYGSYLIGHFAAFKDPGHFVGKGWMELDFDRMVVQPDTIVPINARVIQAANYKVDDLGRIDGKGHAVKDVVTWLIPVLWPIDLINLPRRGPRPVLKPEDKLTLKVIDDFGIPTPQENAVRNPAIASRVTSDEPTYQDYQSPQLQRRPMYQEPAPVQQAYQQQPQYAPQPQQYYAPPVQYAPRPQYQQPVVVNNYVQQAPRPMYQRPPVVYAYPPPPPVVVAAPYPYGYRMGPYGPY
ncbi:hypothetical protein SAMN05421819_3885 [Bryocella elongata]|uniref:Uncharacterized protein n=1 Tax=Bryocella elongata TaxID=863522 RepID=A0A1H6BNS6_9BACT|nr:hypothetical protein [Bryocella elongata]SEG62330.1 hypothetical protein SAMN05421819_3885 [Bryocella elongata]